MQFPIQSYLKYTCIADIKLFGIHIYIFFKLIISKMIINNKNLTGTLFYKEIQIKILEERVV